MVPLWLGGTLHSEKSPVSKRSTPEFLGCPSGDLLKGSEPWRNWEEIEGKSSPYQENNATV